jgi:hypothetical protein
VFADEVRLISFKEHDLGFFDKEQDRVEPGPNPFGPDKVLTMCPEDSLKESFESIRSCGS